MENHEETVIKKRKIPKPIINDTDQSMITFLVAILKKVAIAGVIYLIGYMNWSVAWILTPIILTESQKLLRESNVVKRKMVKDSAKGREKDVILARVKDLPAWVYFPDFERVEWINCILQQMWPNLDDFLSKKILKNYLEPKLRKAFNKKLKINDFEFDRNRIVIGSTPLRIGGVKVYDKNTSRDEIILDVDILFASESNINFKLAGMSGAIKDFEINGRLRVILKPLTSKAPFFGGVQFFFLDKPEIDFKLDGAADVLKMSVISDVVHHLIVKKITNKMVAPNKISKRINKEVSSVEVKTHEPAGVLRMNIVEARNLIKSDIGFLGSGKSDPYVVATIGAQQFRTRTIEDCLNPVWDYWCELCIDVKSSAVIKFDVFDWDLTGGDDPLGSGSVDMSNVWKYGTLDTWLALENVKHGELHVRFEWLELSSASSDLPVALDLASEFEKAKISTALLCVYLDSASDLPQIRPPDNPDAFARLTIGHDERYTPIKKETDAPAWETPFNFLIRNPEHDNVHIEILSKNSNKKNGDCLGEFTYQINELLTQNGLHSVLQSYPLKKSGTTSKVTLQFELKILKKTAIKSLEPIDFTESPTIQKTGVIQWAHNTPRTPSPPKYDSIEVGVECVTSDTLNEASNGTSNGALNETNGDLSPKNVLKFDLQPENLVKSPHIIDTPAATGLCQIKLTLLYNSKEEILYVTVHKVINIPMKDPSHIPDPYVTLYLLPGRAKNTKRKTVVIKDSCDPVYETIFEYELSSAELNEREVEVAVKTRATLFRESCAIGLTKIPLKDIHLIDREHTNFYELSREI